MPQGNASVGIKMGVGGGFVGVRTLEICQGMQNPLPEPSVLRAKRFLGCQPTWLMPKDKLPQSQSLSQWIYMAYICA